jgi:hypothetical protein
VITYPRSIGLNSSFHFLFKSLIPFLYRWIDQQAGGKKPGGEKEPNKRKSMKALDKVIIVLEGTVEKRECGGVQYTQDECCIIHEHWSNNGVAGMKNCAQQVEKAFAVRAKQVMSSTKVKGEVRAIAIPSVETLKDINDAVGLILNCRAQELSQGTHGQPPSRFIFICQHFPPPPPPSSPFPSHTPSPSTHSLLPHHSHLLPFVLLPHRRQPLRGADYQTLP